MLYQTFGLLTVLALAGLASAAAIQIPGGSVTVSSLSSAGASFMYSGTLTQSDTLQLTASGDPCLQAGPQYCTNAAAVIVVAGTSGVGQTATFSGTFGSTSGTWNLGSLLLEISGIGTVPVFPTNAANGLGSSAPPMSLSLSNTSLAALGFANFSVANPTLTFVMADSFYTDNSGSFSLSQATVPEPGDWVLFGLGLAAMAAVQLRRRSTVSQHLA